LVLVVQVRQEGQQQTVLVMEVLRVVIHNLELFISQGLWVVVVVVLLVLVSVAWATRVV
jgi:hypothetical protein